MEIKFDKLVDEFYFTFVKDKYPDIDLKHLRIILRGPFEMLRDQVENADNIENVRLKYLGIFYIKRYMIKHLLKSNEAKFKKGMITEKQFQDKQNKLLKKLKEYESGDLEEC